MGWNWGRWHRDVVVLPGTVRNIIVQKDRRQLAKKRESQSWHSKESAKSANLTRREKEAMLLISQEQQDSSLEQIIHHWTLPLSGQMHSCPFGAQQSSISVKRHSFFYDGVKNGMTFISSIREPWCFVSNYKMGDLEGNHGELPSPDVHIIVNASQFRIKWLASPKTLSLSIGFNSRASNSGVICRNQEGNAGYKCCNLVIAAD